MVFLIPPITTDVMHGRVLYTESYQIRAICELRNAHIPPSILFSAGVVPVHGRGGAPAPAGADEAVPHLAADLAARRLGAAQGGQARRRLRPPRRHGQPRARREDQINHKIVHIHCGS